MIGTFITSEGEGLINQYESMKLREAKLTTGGSRRLASVPVPFREAEAGCKNMNIDCTGQSMGNILNLIVEETIKVLPKSPHNPHVFDTFKKKK